MSQPELINQREAPNHTMDKPTPTRPKEWNCCWVNAVCTMAGMPPEETGKWAKAALKTTLMQALTAPEIKKSRAGKDSLP
jgi:hypothetical protein